jgi:outer membrane lipoprotein-sorting protein
MKKIFMFLGIVLFSGIMLSACGGQKTEEKKAEKYTANLKELAEKGKPFKCSFEMDENGLISSGTYYIDPASQMTKGETKMLMEIEGEEKEVIHYMIAKEGSVYTWQSGNSQGMLFKDEDASEVEEVEDVEVDEEFVFDDKEMEYEGVEWKVDKSVFDLPKDVQFDDISKQMEEYMNIPENIEGMEEMDIDMSQYISLEE